MQSEPTSQAFLITPIINADESIFLAHSSLVDSPCELSATSDLDEQLITKLLPYYVQFFGHSPHDFMPALVPPYLVMSKSMVEYDLDTKVDGHYLDLEHELMEYSHTLENFRLATIISSGFYLDAPFTFAIDKDNLDVIYVWPSYNPPIVFNNPCHLTEDQFSNFTKFIDSDPKEYIIRATALYEYAANVRDPQIILILLFAVLEALFNDDGNCITSKISVCTSNLEYGEADQDTAIKCKNWLSKVYDARSCFIHGSGSSKKASANDLSTLIRLREITHSVLLKAIQQNMDQTNLIEKYNPLKSKNDF